MITSLGGRPVRLGGNNYDKSLMQSGFTLSVVDNNNNLEYDSRPTYLPNEQTNKLNPWFVTGFTDAEGCFLINVRPNSKLNSGYSVELVFKIALHSKDSALVREFLNYFGVGTVTNRGALCAQYWVGSIKDLDIIINHFDNYPLISQKRSDFELFKQVFELLQRKEHLTYEGINKIVSIKAVFNNGLSENLRVAFPNIVPAIRPTVKGVIPNPQWLSGFVSGEGCFMVKLIKSSDTQIGFQIQLHFVITQHCRDEELLKSFEYYLNCGSFYKTKRGEVYFYVRKFSHLNEIIIPFFKKYNILGVKSEDFDDFCKVADMMKHKQHLTEDGLTLIRQIRTGMNKNRSNAQRGGFTLQEDEPSRVSRNNILLDNQNNNTTISLAARLRHKYSALRRSNIPTTLRTHKMGSSKLMNTQSAENCKEFSETIRQLPDTEDYKFWSWFAGVIDGDGNFDIRNLTGNKRVLKQIRIKLHNRDVRILTRIQNYLHIGRIRADKNKPYSIYIVSTKENMLYIVKNINGLIRLKVPGFKEACDLYDIAYIEANYNIDLYDPYFAGLVDTDGSIVFNYAGNRIECNLEFQYNEYSSKLNFDNTILNCKPTILIRKKSSGGTKKFTSIAFKFQNVNSMLFIYDYFMHNRLYCDMKFYRVTKIKPFIEIRKYKTSPVDSIEHKIYSDFVIDWLKYENPLWYKVPCVSKYLLYKDK